MKALFAVIFLTSLLLSEPIKIVGQKSYLVNHSNLKKYKKNTRLKLITILVSFSDISITTKKKYWKKKIYGKSFGSVRDYYLKNSRGNIEINNAINDIIEVKLDVSSPKNNKEMNNIRYKILDYLKKRNYSLEKFDKNKDSKLTQNELSVLLIIAGDEKALYPNEAEKSGIHGHAKHYINYYYKDIKMELMIASVGEYNDRKNKIPGNIGVIAHELGHAFFNFYDLYFYNIGIWGLMGSGNWGGKDNTIKNMGKIPVHINPYYKIKEGWIKVKEAKGYDNILYDSNSKYYNAYKITLSKDGTKYFLIDNKSTKGYDSGYQKLINYHGGLLIQFIDENPSNKNGLNRITPILAKSYSDKNRNKIDHGNNLFFKENISSVELLYNKKIYKIYDISKSGKKMSFNLKKKRI